ncbi:MAG: universal stress protein [Pseudomonadota bacterium]|nr:universal stress protein [Pseudomonadota bacterium]
MFKSILVPIDFSESASQVVRLAVQVARAGGGKLTLLHVGMAPGAQAVETYGVPVSAVLPELYDQLAKEGLHVLQRLGREEVPEDVEWRAVARDGYAADEILAEVGTGAYDLLVMGTHGRRGLTRAVLGSVTEHVIREAKVPVLVTK